MSGPTHTMPAIYFRPAIPATLALIVGIILGHRMPGFALCAALLLLATAAGCLLCLRKDRPATWLPLAAVTAAGYLSMAPWVTPLHGPDHLTRIMDDDYWRIEATVIDPPVHRFGQIRFIAAVDRLSRDENSHPVKGRIGVTVMGEAAARPGDRVTFAARIRGFRNFRNPGGFDYRRYMAYQGIHGSAWVQAEKLHTDRRPTAASGRWLIHDFRERLGSLIDGAGTDDRADEKAVLKALVYGNRAEIDPALRERFNRAGVGHLLAISGLHVGIVATLAFGIFKWLFSFIPAVLWRGWGRPLAAGAALLPVLAYGMLAGMTPSTQRAVIMVTVFLAAMMLGRSHDVLNTLAVAALTILITSPAALFSISFQLSFAAVLAIVYGLDRLGIAAQTTEGAAGRATRRLAGFVLVSALAIAGTAPVVLYHFNQTSLVGLAANLLLVPLVGFVVVPLGLASAFLAMVAEPLTTLGFRLSGEILHLALTLVDGFAALPFAALTTVTPSLPEIVLYYAAGWALLNLRRTAVARWVLVVIAVAALGDGLYWSYQRFWHRDLRVTAIDVGQGTATLMELPGGPVMLVDGGGFGDNRRFDVGRQVVAPLLWRKKIATVDILVLSHPNADHLNGLIFIARHFGVRELWTNGDVNSTRGYEELMAVCRKKAIDVRRWDAGSDATVIGPVRLAVLHPAAGWDRQTVASDQEMRNNASLVLQATFGQTAFLLTGDILSRAEAELAVRAGDALASTVLFAPHHGSRTSSSTELIAAVKPEIVVISAGSGNRFGFPHDEVTQRYRNAGSRLLCTCSHGAVMLTSDGIAVKTASVASPAAAHLPGLN